MSYPMPVTILALLFDTLVAGFVPYGPSHDGNHFFRGVELVH